VDLSKAALPIWAHPCAARRWTSVHHLGRGNCNYVVPEAANIQYIVNLAQGCYRATLTVYRYQLGPFDPGVGMLHSLYLWAGLGQILELHRVLVEVGGDKLLGAGVLPFHPILFVGHLNYHTRLMLC
jgi:hypothetical protein